MSGPIVNAGNGTTEELRRELERLESERQAVALENPPKYPDYQISQKEKAYWSQIKRLKSYINDRGNSTLSDCPTRLIFNGTTIADETGTPSWAGVSGQPNSNGVFVNSGARQRLKNIGPIPEGEYWLDPCEINTTSWRHKLWPWTNGWGNASLLIHPFHSTHCFGRGGFFIHGGVTPGSAGCVDLTASMGPFITYLRGLGCCKKSCKIILEVRYP